LVPEEAAILDLLTLIRLIRRNIVAALLASVLALGLVGYAVANAPAVYLSSGSMVLFSPPTPPEPVAVDDGEGAPPTTVATDNPYARFNDLSVVVDIVKRVLLSREVDQRLRAAGVIGTYTVAANIDFYRGPIIDIASEAPTPEASQRSTELVMAELAVALDDLQANQGTDADYRIVAQSVVPPNPGTRVLSSTVRRGMAAMVLATGMSIGILILADSVRRGRNRRRDRRSAAATPDDPRDDGLSFGDDTLTAADLDRMTLEVVPNDLVDSSRNVFGPRRIRVPDDGADVTPAAIRQLP
jgi:hypothetical protein